MVTIKQLMQITLSFYLELKEKTSQLTTSFLKMALIYYSLML